MKTSYNYNRKSIMNHAWKLVREAGKTIAEALRIAWANAKTIRSAVEAFGATEEVHTWAEWKARGLEVIHESKCLFKVTVLDHKTKNGTRVLSYFGLSQTAPVEVVG